MDTHFKKLDQDLEQLENVIRSATIARNATRPVNLLSNEILSAIFANYQALEFSAHGDCRQWMPAHVCRRWRRIALDSARFWRYITVSHNTSLETLEELIRRSGNVPLAVSLVSLYRRNTNLPRLEDIPALNRVFKELSRIQTLLVTGDAELFKYVLATLDVDTPVLSELSLLPETDPCYECSSFRDGVNLPQCGPVLKHTLRVVSLTLSGIPKIDDLRTALNGLPHIEVLHLLVDTQKRFTRSNIAVFVEQPIPMPHLRTLRLSVFDPSVSTLLLHSLVIPPSCTLCVDWLGLEFDSRTTPTIDHILAIKHWGTNKDLDSAPLIMLDSGSGELGPFSVSLSLWWDLDFLTLESTGYRRTPMLSVNTSRYTRHRLDSLLHRMRILSKTRRVILGDLVVNDVWLYYMENLEELSIRYDKPASSHVLINALQCRISQNAPTLMFPKLQKLHLHSITFDNSWEPLSQTRKYDDSHARSVDPDSTLATLSLDCLKTALEKRKKDGLPVSSLELTSPVGLQRSELRLLADVVDIISLDGEIISDASAAASVDQSPQAEEDKKYCVAM